MFVTKDLPRLTKVTCLVYHFASAWISRALDTIYSSAMNAVFKHHHVWLPLGKFRLRLLRFVPQVSLRLAWRRNVRTNSKDVNISPSKFRFYQQLRQVKRTPQQMLSYMTTDKITSNNKCSLFPRLTLLPPQERFHQYSVLVRPVRLTCLLYTSPSPRD